MPDQFSIASSGSSCGDGGWGKGGGRDEVFGKHDGGAVSCRFAITCRLQGVRRRRPNSRHVQSLTGEQIGDSQADKLVQIVHHQSSERTCKLHDIRKC
jgi:hypothetical protein